MTYADDLYADISQALESVMSDDTTEAGISSCYRRLGRILDRLLKERTQEDNVEYCGLMPRIYALAQRHNTSHQPLCVLYSNIIRTGKGSYHPQKADLLYDVKALCQAIAAFYSEPIPDDLAEQLPDQWRNWHPSSNHTSVNIRLIVREWDERYVRGYDVSDPSQTLLMVEHTERWRLAEQLYPLATLNLIDTATDEEGILRPRLFVLEPDYLVDITVVCQCLKETGASPLYYLLDKFLPREETLAIQLGNVANQLLDDILNHDGTFRDSMKKSFRDYPLRYCTLEGIDEDFFQQCQEQYQNIRHAVEHQFHDVGIESDRDGVMLEPSFLCETLGLQGRMDLLTGDLRNIVELKSGKQDEYHGTFRMEHALQMALYKEILHYSLERSRSEVTTCLLYSRYPLLHNIRLGQDYIAQALTLRNGIVHIDRQLRTNAREFLLSLREEDFRSSSQPSSLYINYVKPRIDRFLHTLHHASPLSFDYFCTMTAFICREQFLAKVGDDRPDGDRGFAQAWLCDTETKRLHGNIVTDLRLKPVTDQRGMLTHIEAYPENGMDDSINFRESDSVLLYERNNEGDLITNRQTVRCSIEALHPERILLRLSYPQRGMTGFSANSRYAIEPAYSDSLFAKQYRGLYALLLCPSERRDLLLGLRSPQSDASASSRIPIVNSEVRQVVTSAIQSRDYYLLVGPPGSGKTSIALSHIVQELLSHAPSENILLMAYTNRAVDEICQMLESIQPIPDYVRIGQELTCEPSLRHRLLRNVIADCQDRKQTLARLAPVNIVCGTVATLTGATDLFRLKHFTTAILDEASQVLEPQLMPLLCNPAIGRFIMIGDHRQLPAVVVQHPSQSRVSDERLREAGLLDCRQSLFERLHRTAIRLKCPHAVGMLTHQGRMHEAIGRFASQAYYGEQLNIVPLPHQTGNLDWKHYNHDDPMQSLVARHRMALVDVVESAHASNNKVNPSEAEQVVALVRVLYELHILNEKQWAPERGVGIIVPFRAQITLVRQTLERCEIPLWEQITVDTVERYQGSQRDFIIFSTVIRQPYQLQVLSDPVEADGQPVDRKLNVAVTRARCQFFLVGNRRLLYHSPAYRQLIQYIEEKASLTP